mmetsp:Transcript_107349/g.341992  ORF Transcript_107349/g.341992 Transcript_107349/m.341992 type:complete len:309 (+) Transcript_107349:994-1920(+)
MPRWLCSASSTIPIVSRARGCLAGSEALLCSLPWVSLASASGPSAEPSSSQLNTVTSAASCSAAGKMLVALHSREYNSPSPQGTVAVALSSTEGCVLVALCSVGAGRPPPVGSVLVALCSTSGSVPVALCSEGRWVFCTMLVFMHASPTRGSVLVALCSTPARRPSSTDIAPVALSSQATLLGDEATLHDSKIDASSTSSSATMAAIARPPKGTLRSALSMTLMRRRRQQSSDSIPYFLVRSRQAAMWARGGGRAAAGWAAGLPGAGIARLTSSLSTHSCTNATGSSGWLSIMSTVNWDSTGSSCSAK